MAVRLSIDVVSDVACPWCAVGLFALERALERLDGEVLAELRFVPFELNPQMGPEGQDLSEHLTQKYGSTPEQQARDLDVLLLELADAGVRRLSLECRPSRSRSLYVAVWRQDGRKHCVEARSVGAVLRRVLRAARTVSGDTGVKGQVA